MAYASRNMGPCYKCGGDITAGERYAHNRHVAGQRFHIACGTIASGGKKVILPTGTAAPAPSSWPGTVATPDALTPETPQAEAIAQAAKARAARSKPKPKTWGDTLVQCMEAGARRGLLIGPPGTGKSTTASADVHCFRVTCHEDMGPEALLGTFIQKDGQTVWVDGAAVRAMRLGTRLVLDEIDHTSPECMSILYALMDDRPSVMLPTGEFVEAVLGDEPGEGYTVIATTNGNPGDLPDAILDRVEFVVLADTPHEKAHAKLASVAADSGRADAILATMKNHYRSQGSSGANSGWVWRGTPTFRRMLSFARFLSYGMNDAVAAEACFGQAGREILSVMATAGK